MNTMDILTAIHTRRSVRAFTPEPVSGGDVRTMLSAAMAAPSAGNSQPWQFVVIDDVSLLEKIPAINPYAGMAKNAPLAILVCGFPEVEKHPGFWPLDCAAATQNMLLAAVGLGLGAVWTGVYPLEDRCASFADLLGLPQGVIPFSLVIAGHPKTAQASQDRFDAARVHANTWA